MTTVALGWGLGVLINPADVAAVADGVLVNAVWAVGQMAARPRESRRAAIGMDTAGWMDTERLTRERLPGARLELPELTDGEAAELEAALKRDEVQGALQALLAARLTDAPETDATRARQVVAARLAALEAVRLAVGGAGTSPGVSTGTGTGRTISPREPTDTGADSVAARYAERLSDYFDDKISALVATLEGQVGYTGLAQVRAEAYNSRIVALLGAIERQMAALADPTRGARTETEFIDHYRRQVHQRHGFLTPPDFDRRRRVPIDDIYVPTGIREDDHPERTRLTPATQPGSLKLWDLIGQLDRTVLLGDPGGGKTTAANVLTDYFASDATRKIPFLVTLREYAANTPLKWSVAEYIEHSLNTLYQSHAPDGLVERLLLTGRAVVIFDGLDELLDTSRRRDVSDRVEQFCSAYPLTPVLVTSRAVGYDQARLDDAQFSCYRLGGFGNDEVADYARKWFVTQEGVTAAEAGAKARSFLAESENAEDLRANPLLLSLMCILYRGAGSLPGDRAGIYARCAELLLRKWDDQRDLYRKLRADYLVEPALRQLAWWLFTREDSSAAATERELIAETARFLHGRGFESEDEARSAAREFVEFSRGRIWVFSDAGTTGDGEKLYAFTHRTFLEYFAAWHLAASSDTPEELADRLFASVQSASWEFIGELAIQLKDRATDQGADRTYRQALARAEHADQAARDAILDMLVRWLPGMPLSPPITRRLIQAVLGQVRETIPENYLLSLLLERGARYQHAIVDELRSGIAMMVASEEEATQVVGLRMVLGAYLFRGTGFGRRLLEEITDTYAAEILALSSHSAVLRTLALYARIIPIEQALAMPGGFGALMGVTVQYFRGQHLPAYPAALCIVLESKLDLDDTISKLAVIGRHLANDPVLPWASRGPKSGPSIEPVPGLSWRHPPSPSGEFPDDVERQFDEFSGLGVAAVVAVSTELGHHDRVSRTSSIERLPLLENSRQFFRDWAEGRVNLVAAPEEQFADGAELRDRSG